LLEIQISKATNVMYDIYIQYTMLFIWDYRVTQHSGIDYIKLYNN